MMTDDLSIKSTDKTLLGIGAVAGVAPFFISISSSSSTTVNGVVTSSSYSDPVAIIGGAVAILCGLAAAFIANKNKAGAARIAAGVAVLALGGYQVAHGLGVIISG